MSAVIPVQLTNLLLNMPLDYSSFFTDLFTILPKHLSSLFPHRLISILTSLYTTLPTAVTSLPAGNFIPGSHVFPLVSGFTTLLTILFGTVFTTVTLAFPSQRLGDRCSQLLAALHSVLYANRPPDLPTLVNSLQGVLVNLPAVQPYNTLTNFPSELFSLLNTTLPFDLLRPLTKECDNHLKNLVDHMFEDIDYMCNVLKNETRLVYLKTLTDLDPYVYRAKADAETDPDMCPVCLEEMTNGELARRLRCLHVFHMVCIDRWLNTNNACPMCRTSVRSTT